MLSALLQNSWRAIIVIIYISITMSANHALPYPRIVTNVCIEVSQKDRGFVNFNLSQGIASFLHKMRVELVCTWIWSTYLYKHRVKEVV